MTHTYSRCSLLFLCDAPTNEIEAQAPYVFPIVGGRTVEQLKRNIAALKIELSNDEITKIESVVPFDFGYPHSLLSENRYKRISTADPAFVISRSGFFDGIEETMVFLSLSLDY